MGKLTISGLDGKVEEKHKEHCIDHPTPLRRVTEREQQNQMPASDVVQLKREREEKEQYIEGRMCVACSTHHR